ncbi:MAG TPA: hypothetical protein VM599_04980, partial [Thermoanaerobaculia bacterium]|nr:hypothetical protein [Thermoanaerobaculia bacterium]
ARSAEGAEDTDLAVTGVRVEACLTLLGTAASETLFVGETTDLVFRVTNCGPSDSPGGELTVLLPPALVFAGSADGCGPSPGPRRVRCPVPPLPVGGAIELGFVARAVRASAGPVSVTARLLGGGDPTGVHVAVLTTTVLAGPDLVLPFFEVAPPAGLGAAFRVERQADDGATTLLAVQNLTAEPVRLRLDYLASDGAPLLVDEGVALCGGAVHTVNLRDLPELFTGDRARATGYVRATRIGPAGDALECPLPAEPPVEAPPPPLAALAGDFLRIDPGRKWASGGPLLATDPERVPRELCRRWSVRFSLGEPFGADTELVFWVADNPRDVQPVVRGTAYAGNGVPLRELAISTSDRAFTRRLSELLGPIVVSGVPELAGSGTIEWRFPPGVAGHVSAVLGSPGRDTFAVSGDCLDPRPADLLPPEQGEEPAPYLVLPFFDLDLGLDDEMKGERTVVNLRNEGPAAAVELRYFDAKAGCLLRSELNFLPAKGVRRIDLRELADQGQLDPCLQELTAGYLEIHEASFEVNQQKGAIHFADDLFLSGDYVRISADRSEAVGAALVDTDPHLSPPHLCRRWSTRLIHGLGAETDFVFFAPVDEGNEFVEALEVTGTFRDETGGCLSVPSGETCLEQVVLAPDAVAFQVGSGDQRLGLGEGELFGTVEWTFPAGRPGHITTRFRSPRSFAAELPAVCLEP